MSRTHFKASQVIRVLRYFNVLKNFLRTHFQAYVHIRVRIFFLNIKNGNDEMSS